MSVLTYKCWIGKENSFPQEIEKLLLLLTSLRDGSINLYLSSELKEEFYWICDNNVKDDWRLNKINIGGNISIFTSGTTGESKIITKNVNEILSSKKGNGKNTDSWLLTYNPARWAGLSVLLHIIKNNCAVVVPKDLRIESISNEIRNCTHVSLTPSLFKKIMMRNANVKWENIKQITFGGEYATQKLLDDAKKVFPKAKITHMYATTEHGDICAVSDGKEGIPIDKLKDFKYDNSSNSLIINGKNTHDLWDLRNNRLYFIGRDSEIINVGGAKVSPTMIENVVNNVNGIMESKAFAVSNALLGQVVGLDYVGTLSSQDLKKILVNSLPKHAVPLVINQVKNIELTSANKVNRK